MTTKEDSFPVEQSADDILDVGHLKQDLKGRSIRAGAATMLGQAIKFMIRLCSIAVLSRLLTPKDFGLVAMVAVFTEFILMFKDMGLSTATIQREDVSHAQISTLFWINAAIGLMLAVITAASAKAISLFYKEPRLTAVTAVLAIGLLFGGLTIQHEALLKRKMRFSLLAVIEVITLTIGVSAGIISAVLKAGYWSLVLMQLSTSASYAVGVWIVSGWRPGRPRLRSGIRSMLNFGWNIVGYRMVSYVSRYTDHILLGRFGGTFVLGLYSRAYSLLMLPLSQITWPLTSVAIPALSRIQNEPRRYLSYYMKMIQLMSFISMPITILMAICSKSVINVVLGSQWTGASLIFQILAITAFIQPLSSTAGIVLLSLGRGDRLLRYGIINSVFLVISFAIGVHWGAVGIAVGYAVSSYLLLFPLLWYCFRDTPVSVKASIATIYRPVIVSVITALAVMYISSYLYNMSDIVIVVISFIIAVPLYLFIWFLIPGGRQVLQDFIGYIKTILPKNIPSKIESKIAHN